MSMVTVSNKPQVIYRFDTVVPPPSNIFLAKLSVVSNNLLLFVQFEELFLLAINLQTKKRWNVELEAATFCQMGSIGVSMGEIRRFGYIKGFELYKVVGTNRYLH